MKKQHNIALIFFSRNKAEEAKQKSWFKEQSKNQMLAEMLIERASNAIQTTGIPVYHFNEKKQKGNSFGERIANAYQEIFDLGYEQVISVGNDCPDLQNINWIELSQSLQNGQSVLGPDTRGGAYLIGIQKKSFDKTQFEKLNWQKNTLYEDLAKFCSASTSLVELDQYRDVNTFHDIQFLSKQKSFANSFLKLITQLLRTFKGIAIEFQIKSHDFYIFKDSPLRAPPIK